MSQSPPAVTLHGGREGTVGDPARLGVLTVSDRASAGTYEDLSGPAILQFFEQAVASPWTSDYRVIPDEQPEIEQAIIDMVRARRRCVAEPRCGQTRPWPQRLQAACAPVLQNNKLQPLL